MASPCLKGKSIDMQNRTTQKATRSALCLSPLNTSPPDRKKSRKDILQWVKHTATPHFDGYFWRKYGQKSIMGSAFPRLYYRCSYREDKQCLATKQVQQENDGDSPMFNVTSLYQHTCNTVPFPTPDVIVADSNQPTSADSPFLLSFSGDGRQMKQQEKFLPTAPWRPLLMPSLDSIIPLHEQPPDFPSHLPPMEFSSASGLPALPPSITYGVEGFSTWDSFGYGENTCLSPFSGSPDYVWQ